MPPWAHHYCWNHPRFASSAPGSHPNSLLCSPLSREASCQKEGTRISHARRNACPDHCFYPGSLSGESLAWAKKLGLHRGTGCTGPLLPATVPVPEPAPKNQAHMVKRRGEKHKGGCISQQKLVPISLSSHPFLDFPALWFSTSHEGGDRVWKSAPKTGWVKDPAPQLCFEKCSANWSGWVSGQVFFGTKKRNADLFLQSHTGPLPTRAMRQRTADRALAAGSGLDVPWGILPIIN